MTLKCWDAPPRKLSAVDPSAPSVESLLAQAVAQPRGRGSRAAPKSARCRTQSSNWDSLDADSAADADGEDAFDATAATIPAPSHHMHAMPALWVSGRRRHSRSRSWRRRASSENCPPYSNNSTPTSSTVSSTSASASTGGHSPADVNRRLRIRNPAGSRGTGWVRGQPADVQWDVLDPSVHHVRIDVCNVAWTVPTTIAHRVANDGSYRWRRVYWGMPIADGYYVNVYDASEQQGAAVADLSLLAQSERFAVIK
ncbi:hypothetical protein BBJ28_00018407 [Nothophytophthora sp. Chile5]|nr:hypothetical protein BBJ28_00018407 [Nothophytophthora sp. Chile5]